MVLFYFVCNFVENRKYKDSQIFRELHYIFDFYKLQPMMFVGYDRLSYKQKNAYDEMSEEEIKIPRSVRNGDF